jgi:hypothetical protein
LLEGVEHVGLRCPGRVAEPDRAGDGLQDEARGVEDLDLGVGAGRGEGATGRRQLEVAEVAGVGVLGATVSIVTNTSAVLSRWVTRRTRSLAGKRIFLPSVPVVSRTSLKVLLAGR